MHDAEGPDFFDVHSHVFSAHDQLDDALRDAFASRRGAYVDTRDPLAVLTVIGERRTWTGADLMLMARQLPDDFERILEGLRGKALRPALEMLVAMGNGHNEHAGAIREASRAAFRRIADKSPMRARKIAGYGIVFDEPEARGVDEVELRTGPRGTVR